MDKPKRPRLTRNMATRRKRDNRPGSMPEYIYRGGLLEKPLAEGETDVVVGCVGGCYC